MPVREINQAGINLIKHFEGIVDGNKSTPNYDPYLDPVGIWTIGYGHAIYYQNAFLRGEANRAKAMSLYPGGLNMTQVEALLRSDLINTCRDVSSLVTVAVNDNQFAALVSFTFNVGATALKNSTLLKKLNAKDYAGAANEFKRWDKADGKVLDGLTKRRLAEMQLFNS
jgi:lysozyme